MLCFAGVSQSALSLVYSGSRNPGTELCEKIAVALRIPPATVFQQAGILSAPKERNEKINEVLYILEQLNEKNQSDVADYVRLRLQIQERDGGGHAAEGDTVPIE